MTIIFTEEEKEWIDMQPFKWVLKEGCPQGIRKTIESKLKKLNKAY